MMRESRDSGIIDNYAPSPIIIVSFPLFSIGKIAASVIGPHVWEDLRAATHAKPRRTTNILIGVCRVGGIRSCLVLPF